MLRLFSVMLPTQKSYVGTLPCASRVWYKIILVML